jgi:hypothetical protein
MLFCLYFFFSFFFLDLGGGWQAGALILGIKYTLPHLASLAYALTS